MVLEETFALNFRLACLQAILENKGEIGEYIVRSENLPSIGYRYMYESHLAEILSYVGTCAPPKNQKEEEICLLPPMKKKGKGIPAERKEPLAPHKCWFDGATCVPETSAWVIGSFVNSRGHSHYEICTYDHDDKQWRILSSGADLPPPSRWRY